MQYSTVLWLICLCALFCARYSRAIDSNTLDLFQIGLFLLQIPFSTDATMYYVSLREFFHECVLLYCNNHSCSPITHGYAPSNKDEKMWIVYVLVLVNRSYSKYNIVTYKFKYSIDVIDDVLLILILNHNMRTMKESKLEATF